MCQSRYSMAIRVWWIDGLGSLAIVWLLVKEGCNAR